VVIRRKQLRQTESLHMQYSAGDHVHSQTRKLPTAIPTSNIRAKMGAMYGNRGRVTGDKGERDMFIASFTTNNVEARMSTTLLAR
jgi:hypothetical protein